MSLRNGLPAIKLLKYNYCAVFGIIFLKPSGIYPFCFLRYSLGDIPIIL